MTATTASTPAAAPAQVAEELAGRLFEAGLGSLRAGHRRPRRPARASTGRWPTAGRPRPSSWPTRTGLDARYTREWCEQQAVADLLAVDDPEQPPPSSADSRLRPGSEAVLLDPESPAYLVPLGEFLAAIGRVLPALEAAFASGAGIPYADYQVQHAQGGFNRPAFTGQLVQEWLPQVPDLHARLAAGGTVAELGCGEGWAAIALAVGYPGLRVDAFDIDPPSIAGGPPARRARPGWPTGCGASSPTSPTRR